MLTKHQIREALGLRSDRDLARLFGISPSAVCLWGDRPIPHAQWLRLRYELRPEVFNAQPAADRAA